MPTADHYLASVTPRQWVEAIAMYRISPFGAEHEAGQRAELLSAVWGAEDHPATVSRILEAWGYGDPAWDNATEEEQEQMTDQALRLAFPRF